MPVIHNGDHAEFETNHANTPPRERPDWPLPSFDARDWAEAFCRRNPTMDEAMMLAWFANALMRGYDEGHGSHARPPVDLLSGLPMGADAMSGLRGCGGVVTFRNGDRFYSLCVGPDRDGDIKVRIEHGAYARYSRDGRLIGRIAESPRDIVEFVRCDCDDPRAKGLDTQVVP